jgi:TatD DNase family protein
MIIDTHSHLNFKAYKNDLDEVVGRTLQDNIWMINVGTKYETSKQAVELAEKYNEGVYSAIGLHPIYAGAEFQKIKTDPEEGEFLVKEENFEKEKYKELALGRSPVGEAKSKKVVAIGEIGLDYYYRPKSKTKLEQFKEKQKQVFIEQLDFAKELDLPAIIHCRMAHEDLTEILKTKNIKGVIHCFTGNLEQAQQYTDMGFYLGINGIIFKFNIDEVIKKVSLDKILVETDCPYLTPLAEGKDKRNEPIFIKHVIQKIADLKNISFEEVAEKTTQNAKNLFKI